MIGVPIAFNGDVGLWMADCGSAAAGIAQPGRRGLYVGSVVFFFWLASGLGCGGQSQRITESGGCLFAMHRISKYFVLLNGKEIVSDSMPRHELHVVQISLS